MIKPIDLRRNRMLDIIKTKEPTPITKHIHVLIVTQNVSNLRIEVQSVIIHKNFPLKISSARLSEKEYSDFISNWIMEAPYDYEIISVNSTDPESVQKAITDNLNEIVTFISSGGKYNPF